MASMTPPSPLKRVVDLGIAIPLLVFAAPLCLALLIAIRLESPGFPLFVQERVGRDRKPFRMYKLRTMARGTANVASHHVSAASITRLGSVLRRLKLDELPQLINVIGGSMSLVGPRPCLFTQTELIAERQRRGLYALRPGVTGPAQLIGVDMSEPARLAEVEASYFARSTPLADLRLILRTLTGAGSGDAARAAGGSGSTGR